MSQFLVQTSAEIAVSGGTSGNVTLNGVGAGNLLTASCINETDGTNTFSASDGVNTWASAVQAGTTFGSTSRAAQILYAANVASGNTAVTIAASASITFRALIQEWSGSATASPLAAADSNAESTAGTSHQASAAGIAPGSPSIAIVVAATNASIGTATPGSGYTSDTVSVASNFREHNVFTAAPTAETGAWTSSNSIKALSVIAAFKAAAVATGRGQIVGGGYGGMIC